MPKQAKHATDDAHEKAAGRKPIKRQRVSDGSMVRHTDFTAWSKKKGVDIYDVQAENLEGRGVGLQTTKVIPNDYRILFIPEEAMFKPNTELLKKDKLFQASSQAKLVVSALFAFSRSSKYKAWMNSWPSREDVMASLPLNWDQKLVDLLPKSTKATYERQLSDYNKDWLACQQIVVTSHYSEADFKYFWCIVNSRSFHWMPPYSKSGYMVMCPFIDYINHGPTGSGVTVTQRSDGYEVTSHREIKASEEIVASYGAHTNDKLLVHYGFILPSTATAPGIDDDCRIDEEVSSMLSDSIKERLSNVGYLGPFALVPISDSDHEKCRWEPCFKTQVAIRATFQTCNEWEYFAENGDDLGDDATEIVNTMLAKRLSGLYKHARDASEAGVSLSSTETATMPDATVRGADMLLKARWSQISDIVSAFGSLWDPQWNVDDSW